MPIDEQKIEHCAEFHAQTEMMKDTMKKLEADMHETKTMMKDFGTKLTSLETNFSWLVKILGFVGGAIAIAIIGAIVKLILKA